ncbi:hypothetical protein R3P38DRAFT_3243553 [Favolaschia claudopus]|uniref:GATA-type domain-containing protein n=1 Tax=Favolaschia claudopus TaxID=2862362 RepID=A0AAV9Z2S7_9AGAR
MGGLSAIDPFDYSSYNPTNDHIPNCTSSAFPASSSPSWLFWDASAHSTFSPHLIGSPLLERPMPQSHLTAGGAFTLFASSATPTNLCGTYEAMLDSQPIDPQPPSPPNLMTNFNPASFHAEHAYEPDLELGGEGTEMESDCLDALTSSNNFETWYSNSEASETSTSQCPLDDFLSDSDSKTICASEMNITFVSSHANPSTYEYEPSPGIRYVGPEQMSAIEHRMMSACDSLLNCNLEDLLRLWPSTHYQQPDSSTALTKQNTLAVAQINDYSRDNTPTRNHCPESLGTPSPTPNSCARSPDGASVWQLCARCSNIFATSWNPPAIEHRSCDACMLDLSRPETQQSSHYLEDDGTGHTDDESKQCSHCHEWKPPAGGEGKGDAWMCNACLVYWRRYREHRPRRLWKKPYHSRMGRGNRGGNPTT